MSKTLVQFDLYSKSAKWPKQVQKK